MSQHSFIFVKLTNEHVCCYNLIEVYIMNVIRNLFVLGTALTLVSCGSTSGGSKSDTPFVTDSCFLNEPIQNGGIEYKVTNVYNTKRIGSEYLYTETENNFVVLSMTVKNITNEEVVVFDDMLLYIIGENTYKVSSTGGMYLDNGFYFSQSVGAGLTKSFDVAYEIPEEYKETDYLMIKASLYSNVCKSIYMRNR